MVLTQIFLISLSPFTAFEDQTATLPGMVLCCPIDLFDKKLNRTCNQQLCLNLKISQIYVNKILPIVFIFSVN